MRREKRRGEGEEKVGGKKALLGSESILKHSHCGWCPHSHPHTFTPSHPHTFTLQTEHHLLLKYASTRGASSLEV